MPDFHFPSNSFSRVCRSTMSNQQTFDFLDGYCSQSCATTGRVGSKESNRQQEDDGSPSVPEAVQEFRSRTDWQDSGVESVVLDPLPQVQVIVPGVILCRGRCDSGAASRNGSSQVAS